MCKLSTFVDSGISGEGGGPPGVGPDISLQPTAKTMVSKALFLWLMEVHSGEGIHL